jgi:glycolate oxidase iron-sulfur subunit
MDAWQRDVHRDVQRVLEAAGAKVALPSRGAACCGALHTHAGLGDDARSLARRVMAALPGEAPVLVDSAGCGAQLKDYGHLLGTAEAEAFSRRVLDVHEWLAPRLDRLPRPEPGSAAVAGPVAVQDPCHLRHVQRAHLPIRTVLGRYVELVELDDEGLCCGAGGAYSALQPELAGRIRDRKVEAIERTGAAIVASANPGCSLHLAAAGIDARHPLSLVAEALDRGGLSRPEAAAPVRLPSGAVGAGVGAGHDTPTTLASDRPPGAVGGAAGGNATGDAGDRPGAPGAPAAPDAGGPTAAAPGVPAAADAGDGAAGGPA